MSKEIAKHKFWMRNAHINQKHFVDLTSAEKDRIARCDGKKDSHPCKNPVFRCTECGNYGCDQIVADKCSKQGFKNGKCLQCGAAGHLVPVMEDELAKFIAEWEVEVPVITESATK